jgi:hypothetical protein
MPLRRLGVTIFVFALGLFVAAPAHGLGEKLGQTKEQLKLAYEVSCIEHGSGRVTVNLTIADEGRLQPLTGVELVIPGESGTGFVDLSIPLAVRNVDGNRRVDLHLKREWAARAEIQLRTRTLDGKSEPLTWYYHSIPISQYLKNPALKNH